MFIVVSTTSVTSDKCLNIHCNPLTFNCSRVLWKWGPCKGIYSGVLQSSSHFGILKWTHSWLVSNPESHQPQPVPLGNLLGIAWGLHSSQTLAACREKFKPVQLSAVELERDHTQEKVSRHTMPESPTHALAASEMKKNKSLRRTKKVTLEFFLEEADPGWPWSQGCLRMHCPSSWSAGHAVYRWWNLEAPGGTEKTVA